MMLDNYLVFGTPQESGSSGGVAGDSDEPGCLYIALC